MKKILVSMMLVAAAALAFTSCNRAELQPASAGFEVTINAGNPSVDAPTKTFISGATPYWNVGDAIGAVIRTTKDEKVEWKNYKFNSDLKEAARVSTFTGATELTGTYYAYYPYASLGASDNGIKIEIPAEQKPGVGTFDGAADVLLSKPFTVSGTKEIANVKFTRATSVVKVVVKGIDVLSGQNLKSFSITADKDIVGRAYFNPETYEFVELYYGKGKKVTATLGDGFAFGTDNPAVFFSLPPVTLEAGSKLVFEGATEDYTISKTVTLQADLPMEASALEIIDLTLSADNVSLKEKGLALPIVDYCLWNTNTSGKDGTSAIDAEDMKDINGVNYVASASKIYWGSDFDYKVGTSSVGAVIKTVPLDLSKKFQVSFLTCDWANASGVVDGSSISVTIDDNETTTQTYELSDELETVTFNFSAATASSYVTISTTKRAYITDIVIAEPGYEPAPAVVAQDIKDVPADGVTDATADIILKNAEGWDVKVTSEGCVSSAKISGSTITYSVKANTLSSPASGSITIELSKDGQKSSKTIQVTQLAGGAIIITPSALPSAYPKTDDVYSESTFTVSDLTFYFKCVANYGSGVQFQKNNGYIANKTAITSGIKSITLKNYPTKHMYPDCVKVYAGTAEKPGETEITGVYSSTEKDANYGYLVDQNASVTFDLSGGNYTYFQIVAGSGGASYFESVEIKTK